MEISTGVDHHWIADATLAFKEILSAETPSPGGQTAENISQLAALAATFADAMAAERNKRGGVRDPSDVREVLAMAEEKLPVFLAFLEDMRKLSEKKHKHDPDGN